MSNPYLNYFSGAEYQWYFNGILYPATSSTYPVPPGEEGLYQVVVTVGSDCGVSDEYEVVIDENVLDVEATIENILCFNDNDGSISLILPSENTPHQILWSNGASSPNIDLLSPGILLIVTITDSKGCYSEEEYETPTNPMSWNLFLIMSYNQDQAATQEKRVYS